MFVNSMRVLVLESPNASTPFFPVLASACCFFDSSGSACYRHELALGRTSLAAFPSAHQRTASILSTARVIHIFPMPSIASIIFCAIIAPVMSPNLDPRLFDLLSDLTAVLGRAGTEIDVVCGYRTSWSNEFLRRTTVGVAKHSQHMLGEAIDIRMPGVPPLSCATRHSVCIVAGSATILNRNLFTWI